MSFTFQGEDKSNHYFIEMLFTDGFLRQFKVMHQLIRMSLNLSPPCHLGTHQLLYGLFYIVLLASRLLLTKSLFNIGTIPYFLWEIRSCYPRAHETYIEHRINSKFFNPSQNSHSPLHISTFNCP